MPQLHLDHILLITQQQIYYAIGAILVFAVAALLCLCFIRRWGGIVLGALLLVGLLGGGAYVGKYVYQHTRTAGITATNGDALIAAAKKSYNVTLSSRQAAGLLAGTASYQPTATTAAFGDVQNVTVPGYDGGIDVQLVYLKNQWRLITHPGSGTYRELTHA